MKATILEAWHGVTGLVGAMVILTGAFFAMAWGACLLRTVLEVTGQHLP